MAHTATDLTDQAAHFMADFEAYPDIAEMSYAARRIVAAAAELFYRSGATATSVRDLTRACGLTPGALYNHFASRDELLYVLVRSGYAKTEQTIAQALLDANPADPDDQLARYVRAFTTLHLRFPEVAQLAHREYVHLTGAHLDDITVRRQALTDTLIGILRAGSEQGNFRFIDGLSATGQASMILDMCGRTSEWFSPAQKAPEGLAERYVVAALRLVGAKSG